jgi:hypothetical protein
MLREKLTKNKLFRKNTLFHGFFSLFSLSFLTESPQISKIIIS